MTQWKTRADCPSGMTLIELLVAMVIFAVGCLLLMDLQTSSMSAAQRATRMTTASFLAESRLEDIQAMAFDEVTLLPQTPVYLTMDGLDCPDGEGNSACYTRVTTVTPASTTSRSCHVSVRVSWKGVDGPRNVTYDTVVSAFGL
jgi:prepilin-type N-terminal cleavage/methylation domain-containing protein